MIDKTGIIEQTNLAFDLIQKLNLEVSYHIHEVDATLPAEAERVITGQRSGYGITATSSAAAKTRGDPVTGRSNQTARGAPVSRGSRKRASSF